MSTTASLRAPLDGGLVITGRYGPREPVETASGTASAFHAGLDFRAPVGTPCYPPLAGVVRDTRTGWRSPASPGIERDDLFRSGMAGNYAAIDTKLGTWILGHLATVAVRPGQHVTTDTVIGGTGGTGGVAPHLHVGLWRPRADGSWYSIDPTRLFKEADMTDEESKMLREVHAWARGLAFGEFPREGEVAELLADAANARELVAPVNGTRYRTVDVLTSHAPATLAAVRQLAAAQGVQLDPDAIAEALIDAGLGADVARDLVAQLSGAEGAAS